MEKEEKRMTRRGGDAICQQAVTHWPKHHLATHHCHTTGPWPAVSLDSELVVSTTSLEQWLVNTSTTSDDTNSSSGSRWDCLLGARWQADSGHAAVCVVSNDGGVVTRGSCERTSVTSLLLDVADNGTLWERGERKDVADVQGRLLSTVDELTSVHALGSDESLGSELVSVWVTESDTSERSTSTSIVDDLLDDTSNVAVSLSEVVVPELGWVLVQVGVGLEDTPRLSL